MRRTGGGSTPVTIVRTDGRHTAVRITARPLCLASGTVEWRGPVVEAVDPGPERDGHRPPDLDARQADALAILGHDVASPLTAILARAELALEHVDSSTRPSPEGFDPAALRSCLEVIVRQSHRLEAMRRDIVVLAAADTAAVKTRCATVDVLAELVAVADLAPLHLTTTIECAGGLLCSVQPSHLSQMLANLVANAVRYAKRDVTLGALLVGDRVRITVEDDGPGVPADVLDNLFTRFSHAGLTPRPIGAGSGLGLFIVRTLATANEGTVHHSAAGGSGTRFTLDLPAA